MQTELELAELRAAYETLGTEYEALLAQVKFTHTILSLLIEQEGGAVIISRDDAENYDGMKTTISMYEAADGEHFVVEVKEREEDAV